MAEFNMTPKYHGFCYSAPNGDILGPNPHRRVRLASTSKLITTLMAIEKLGLDYEYTTSFYYDGENLHIKGDNDPVMSKRKLFFLISQLNNLGITKIKNLTFDKEFKVFSMVEDIAHSEKRPSIELTTKSLKDYFTVSEWNLLKTAYEKFITETPQEVIDELQIRTSLEDIQLSVDSISHVDKNPLKEENLKTYEMISPIIAKYLKIMNIDSNNYIADQVFDKIGGEKEYKKYIEKLVADKFGDYKSLREEFDKKEDNFAFYTGSGLNTTRNGQRVDNYATCAIMVELMKVLDEKLDSITREMQEVVAVPGVDGGTFKTRLNTPRLARSIVAKTGTLKHTSTLLGKVSAEQGDLFFGMFHQMAGWKGNAKIVQNMMVSELLDNYGGPKKFEYKKEFFFPASAPLK
ncbi:D-Ala-D-Ala carboxypeptidase 3 (S13) domain protein [Bacteriovorax sp. Seq25_V]|nr:D-Ala-D-Ala carboxypeptidase 3 (S13) domain protein [Bacteriovorax sp. Seq25_V]